MTKKHFIAIAAAIKELRDDGVTTISIDDMARAIAAVCASCNGQFDRGRFLRACGV